jgi:hypothetical protein
MNLRKFGHFYRLLDRRRGVMRVWAALRLCSGRTVRADGWLALRRLVERDRGVRLSARTLLLVREKWEWSETMGGGDMVRRCPVCLGVERGGFGKAPGHVPGCELGLALEHDGARVAWAVPWKGR